MAVSKIYTVLYQASKLDTVQNPADGVCNFFYGKETDKYPIIITNNN